MRLTKIIAACLTGAIGLLFFLDNLFNLDSAFQIVSFVISGAEQPYYKVFGPTITAGWLTWVTLFVIMAGELAIGILGFSGAFKMFRARSAPAGEFQSAKSNALLSAFIGMVVWYGFFVIVGETYFNMWQSAAGVGAAAGAFRYGSVCAVLLFYIRLSDE